MFQCHDEGPYSALDMIMSEMCLFWAFGIQMGHSLPESLKDCWYIQIQLC